MKYIPPNIPTFNPSQKELVVMEVLRKQILRGVFIFIIVFNVFLFLRIFLRLLGADPNNPFAAFIFAISGIFMLPVFGIFPQFRDTIVAGEMKFDMSAFVAGFCYNVLSISAMVITQIVVSIRRTRRQEKETVEKSKPINQEPVERTFGTNQP